MINTKLITSLLIGAITLLLAGTGATSGKCPDKTATSIQTCSNDTLTRTPGHPDLRFYAHPMLQLIRVLSLTGEVRDATTGRGIKGAVISSKCLDKNIISDAGGDFALFDFPDTSINLSVHAIGYQPICIMQVDIRAAEIMHLMIQMQPCAVRLDRQVLVWGELKKRDYIVGIATISMTGYVRPFITINRETGVPLFNIVPVSEVGLIIDKTDTYEIINAVDRRIKAETQVEYELSRESIHFRFSKIGLSSRAVDLSLPVIDEIDKRRIERRFVRHLLPYRNPHIKK